MAKIWRYSVLALLFAGPFLVYLGFGFLWLLERGWIWPTVAGIVWIASGVAFTLLASRWTRRKGAFLPYLDEEAPGTFSPHDRAAWEFVQAEADASDAIPIEKLTEADVYIDTAKRLALKLAEFYHPGASKPLERVPVLEALAAIELAAEDLSRLSRQIPGSDLVTPRHVKTAIQAAGYYQKASDWYGYLLPLINPATGIPRLVSQNMMVKPAWRDMQQNLAQWFYRAFVNRVGLHLIELYSGRLVVGAERYRKLMRGRRPGIGAEESVEVDRLVIGVAGSQYAGGARLIEALAQSGVENSRLLAARLESTGLDKAAAIRLASADWRLIPIYTVKPDRESARDRATRKKAVEAASEADLLILVIDDRGESRAADLAFLNEWNAWYSTQPQFERPPVIVAAMGTDDARLAGLRTSLPTFVTQVVPIDLSSPSPIDRFLTLVPAIQGKLHEVERVATIRHLSEVSSRSMAGRFFGQLGSHGLKLWKGIRKTDPTSASGDH